MGGDMKKIKAVFQALAVVAMGSWACLHADAAAVARVGDTEYDTLLKALRAARSAAEDDSSSPQSVELLAPSSLDSFTVDFDCVISAAGDAASAAVKGLRQLKVSGSGGVTLVLSNAVFSAGSGAVVDVQPGSRLVLCGDTGLGTVKTASPDGLELRAPFGGLSEMKVSCAGASSSGAPFATFNPAGYGEAAAVADRLVNGADSLLFGRALETGYVVWAEKPCEESEAAVRVEAEGAAAVYYRTLDHALQDVSGEAKITLLKSGERLTWPMNVSSPLEIAGATGGIVVNPAGTAGFSVDSTLLVTNLTFSGYKGNALFDVKKNGLLDMQKNSVIDGASGTNTHSGAVVVRKGGQVVIWRDAAIRNCSSQKYGGGLYLEGDASWVTFRGGAVTGCRAVYGGGIYAGPKAKVRIAHNAYMTKIEGNTSSKGLADNVCLGDGSSVLQLLTKISGTGRIGVHRGLLASDGNGPGDRFCTQINATAADAAASLGYFFNDVDDTLEAGLSEDGKALVWKEPSVAARLLVVKGGGATTNAYETAEEAFGGLAGGDADVILMESVLFEGNLVVAGRVSLTSGDGGPFTLSSRTGAAIVVPSGASLSMANVAASGVADGKAFVRVDGGELVLGDGAVVGPCVGDGSRSANGITVWNGGTITMEEGSEIRDCVNAYDDSNGIVNSGMGGGLLVEEGVAYFRGGTISGCSAFRAGGAAVANTAVAYVSGPVGMTGSTTLAGERGNLVVHDLSGLCLDGEFTGAIGLSEGVGADTNVFGTAVSWRSWGDARALTNSAVRFVHDVTGTTGAAVTNGNADALLVWRSAIAEDGSFVFAGDGGQETYWLVGDGSEVPESPEPPPEPAVVKCEPIAFTAIERLDGGAWLLTLTNGVKHCVYTLYSSGDLENWSEAGRIDPLENVGADGEFTFTGEGDSPRFWKVEGEDGVEP